MKRFYPALVVVFIVLGMIAYIAKGKESDASAVVLSPTPAPTTSSETPTPAASTGPTPAPTTSSFALKDGTHTGKTVSTDYGDVQVAIVVSGGKITAVNVLKQPDFDRRSQEINAQAIPMLKSEVLSAQSANVDSISGASFTSAGFIESLQSAFAS